MLCEVETNRFSDYLPLYQSGDATLGSDEYSQYDVYSCTYIDYSCRYLGTSKGDLDRPWYQVSGSR